MPLIILDFDGTITESDTLASLARAAISHPSHQPNTVTESDWDNIVDAYVQDHKRHLVAYTPSAKDRTDVTSELEFLESLREVERVSLGRVEECGLFAGVGEERLRSEGRRAVDKGVVRLRMGWERFVKEVMKKEEWEVGVVSVNWSREWVKGVM